MKMNSAAGGRGWGTEGDTNGRGPSPLVREFAPNIPVDLLSFLLSNQGSKTAKEIRSDGFKISSEPPALE